MSTTSSIPSVFDTQALAGLKNGLRKDDPQAVKAAARQFEAVLMQMMLKSMRATVQQNGPLDSDQTRFYQELLDSQLAQTMTAKGGLGLAAVIERQLTRRSATADGASAEEVPLNPPARAYPLPAKNPMLPLTGNVDGSRAYPLDQTPARAAQAGTFADNGSGGERARSFAAAVWPQAQAVSRQTGIPASFMVGHAALESGWGRSEPRAADGRPSYNLFGIKAGSQWSGPTVESTTTEYVNGVAEKRLERFRAYGSYGEAFQDYAQLLVQSPRYAAALGSRDAASFAQALQRGGYATDPAYASKLEQVIVGLSSRSGTTSRA